MHHGGAGSPACPDGDLVFQQRLGRNATRCRVPQGPVTGIGCGAGLYPAAGLHPAWSITKATAASRRENPLPTVKHVCSLFGMSFRPDEGLLTHSPRNANQQRISKEIRSRQNGSATSSRSLSIAARMRLRQRLIQVRNDIVHGFDAAAQTHQPVGDAQLLALLRRKVAMRCNGGVEQQAVHVAE